MRRVKESILVLRLITAFICTAIFLPGLTSAGDLEPSAPVAPSMYTLSDIYHRLDSCIGAAVEKTGQKVQYRVHDDGCLEKGVAWTTPRFTDNNDGTVTDNLTGLIWSKDANCFNGFVDWNDAVDYAAALYDRETGYDCGLSDGSTAGDWRLPNIKELQSLIDYGNYDPALPSGHPFTGVQSYYYWSSTTLAVNPDSAFRVYLRQGVVVLSSKSAPDAYYVWPVRGGQ